MKTYKFYTNILLAAVVCIAAASCDLLEQRSRVYDGPTTLEFFPLEETHSLVTQTDSTIVVKVQLIGPQRDEALPLTFSVVDTLTTDVPFYTLPETSVTIPANSSSASFNINVTDDNLATDEAAILVLQLKGAQGIEPEETLDQYKLTLIGD